VPNSKNPAKPHYFLKICRNCRDFEIWKEYAYEIKKKINFTISLYAW
jgi:hypothetical protein